LWFKPCNLNASSSLFQFTHHHNHNTYFPPPHNHLSPYHPSISIAHTQPSIDRQPTHLHIHRPPIHLLSHLRVDMVAELVECPHLRLTSRLPLSPLAPRCLVTTPRTQAQQSTPNSANKSCSTPTSPFRRTTSSFAHTSKPSPRDTVIVTQQRAQFIDQLRIALTRIESLIEHQQAILSTLHECPIDPHTGLTIVSDDVIPTAYRVGATVSRTTTRQNPVLRRSPGPYYRLHPPPPPHCCCCPPPPPPPCFHRGQQHANKSTVFFTTRITVFTSLTTRGLTFTESHSHRFPLYPNNDGHDRAPLTDDAHSWIHFSN
jgi:hypothetical protein